MQQPYLVATHNMIGKPKTGNYMYKLIKSDLCHMEETYEVNIVGWCANNGPDRKKAWQLLCENLFYLIVMLSKHLLTVFIPNGDKHCSCNI